MVNMIEIRPNKRICVFSGSSRKYLTDSNILFFKIMLGTDHLIFWVGGGGGAGGCCLFFFCFFLLLLLLFLSSRFSFYFLPIENQRIFFSQSERPNIFSGVGAGFFPQEFRFIFFL